jgi:hypothetical protein
MAKLTPFEVGQVVAHMHHDLGATKISRIVVREDKSHFSVTAIEDCMNKILQDPKWRGEREAGSGAERKTTKAQDKELVKYTCANRGAKKVTVHHLRTVFGWLHGLSDSLVEDRLHDADMWWLRRRSKFSVTKKYIRERIAYCRTTLTKQQRTLDLWAFTDGTVFYLDRTEEENEHTQRAALGKFCWRKSDSREAMFQECLGPSSYKKAQGHPVRVWGLLAEGRLHIHVLEAGEVLNEDLYTELIDDKFEGWLGGCRYLVQDFERALRCAGPLHALKALQVELVQGYPRSSQDFNAIENVWKLLREELNETLPVGLEDRGDFIIRLNKAVQCMNRKRKAEIEVLSRNQRQRCKDCLETKPCGGRTKW